MKKLILNKFLMASLAITLATSSMQAANETQSWWQRMSDTVAQYGGSQVKSAIVGAASKLAATAKAIPTPCCRRTKAIKKDDNNSKYSDSTHQTSPAGSAAKVKTQHRKKQCYLIMLTLASIASKTLIFALPIGILIGANLEKLVWLATPPVSSDIWLGIHSEIGSASGFLVELPNEKTLFITNDHVIRRKNGKIVTNEFTIQAYISSTERYFKYFFNKLISKNVAKNPSLDMKATVVAADPTVDLAALEITNPQALKYINQKIRLLRVSENLVSKWDLLTCFAPAAGRMHGDSVIAKNAIIINDWIHDLILINHCREYPIPFYKIDSKTLPGESGSACLDTDGGLVGVVSMGTTTYTSIISRFAIYNFLKQVQKQMADSICWSKETTVQENQHFIQIRFEERLKELTQLASWITGKPGYKDHQDFFLDQVKINNALEKFQRSLIKYCPQKTFFDPVVPEETDCD